MQLATNKKANVFLHSLIAFIFIMDETILPVFHPMGIPMKASYLILLFTLVCYLFSLRINRQWSFYISRGSDAKKAVNLFFALIVLSILGELTMGLFAETVNNAPFTDALIYYAFMLSSLILGYSVYRCNTKILIWSLYIYSTINIGLLMFYNYLPGFIKSLYGEYFVTGIRIRGTGGNANTTLLVMNMILMGIVVLFKLKKINITGIHVWLVLVVPILTNIFISSRGEFIHTVLLELFYCYLLIKNEKNKTKTIFRIIILVVVIFAVYSFIFNYLYYVNENIQYGIDRLMTIGDVTDITETDEITTGDVDTIMRPFFRADVFWKRFKHSPIWGAGYSYGATDAFIKSANGYHNDWFRVLASTGILGFACWFAIVKKYVKKASLVVLLPFFLAGLSNTFLQSTHALNIYFFVFGVMSHVTEEDVC